MSVLLTSSSVAGCQFGFRSLSINNARIPSAKSLRSEKRTDRFNSEQNTCFKFKFLPRFKGYENAVIEWDISELPEMQKDMKEMAETLNLLPLKPNEIRTAFKYESLDDEGMDVVWINSGKQRIDDYNPNDITQL